MLSILLLVIVYVCIYYCYCYYYYYYSHQLTIRQACLVLCGCVKPFPLTRQSSALTELRLAGNKLTNVEVIEGLNVEFVLGVRVRVCCAPGVGAYTTYLAFRCTLLQTGQMVLLLACVLHARFPAANTCIHHTHVQKRMLVTLT